MRRPHVKLFVGKKVAFSSSSCAANENWSVRSEPAAGKLLLLGVKCDARGTRQASGCARNPTAKWRNGTISQLHQSLRRDAASNLFFFFLSSSCPSLNVTLMVARRTPSLFRTAGFFFPPAVSKFEGKTSAVQRVMMGVKLWCAPLQDDRRTYSSQPRPSLQQHPPTNNNKSLSHTRLQPLVPISH